ncbi:hypothetical protein [Luteibacter yeojuensis]|uniref:Uncharacterized protein n=1 Tax=Luteibacter yeojuensis TaxID=345309 RepID=A0A0F3KJF6_9GAMM|nr:hypothetical protein [Luteibacter yeojuensis]KJV31291.1 hypothetical protein VI08_13605 [Luteibacter yeojuensis]
MKVAYPHPVSRRVYEIEAEGHDFTVTREGVTVFADGKVVGIDGNRLEADEVICVAKMWVDAQID